MKRSRSSARTASNELATLAVDRERALALTPVSRETLARLDTLVALLLRWQQTSHLVAPSTLPHVWTRHIADSLQLIDLAPQARSWLDLGSGGGFPGLVIACALAATGGASVDLVESNARKAAFLREACRLTGAPANVHAERAEDVVDRFCDRVEIVTARALAPLKSLLQLCFPLLAKPGTIALFPKGRNVEEELGEARRNWNINLNVVPSRTDPAARILVIRGLARRGSTP
jgi:16S rRNA (guanine527-N7)-methyltransferase